jgi:hypothetical protein
LSFSKGVCGGSWQVKINFLSVFLFTMARAISPYGACDLILKSLVAIGFFFFPFFLGFHTALTTFHINRSSNYFIALRIKKVTGFALGACWYFHIGFFCNYWWS